MCLLTCKISRLKQFKHNFSKFLVDLFIIMAGTTRVIWCGDGMAELTEGPALFAGQYYGSQAGIKLRSRSLSSW